ncbi:molecular chaperone [Pantoea sp. 1.19]|uniref:fimbrial biogenesis chaperone n=1 Tax=Pantoea sp. 1.19 TaxID=1925589 RepID=UPI000948A88F|nr:fimbria/pilus periplasmic chaperone [Pantoea sp. 1.19]
MVKSKNIIAAGVILACCATASTAYGAISLDRTRIIFDGGEKSLSVNITNENTQLPYLAQAWLNDAQGEKLTTGPIVVTPPVQRMEPGAKSQVRLMATSATSQLPQDRESLFYFNLREIPPRSDKPNVLQIALQTQIKLFYRPAAIKPKPNAEWQNQLTLERESSGYRITNPTPYYVTIIGLGSSKKAAEEGKFNAVMLAPKSSQSVKAAASATPWLTFIDDYGGRPTLAFDCAGSHCTASQTQS